MPTAILKPPRLRRGDTIGIVAPSLPLISSRRDAYERGKQVLREMGFSLKEGKTTGLARWWAAGTPQEQADDINGMFADPEVKAIVAYAGGFSAMSVLNRLDYHTIRANPKPFLGMSDITLYHLALLARCGLVCFHADNVAEGFGDCWTALGTSRRQYLTRLYQRVLCDEEPVGSIEPGDTWEYWRPGRARGRLIGGCLKRLTALAATPFFPAAHAFDGAILFWEEIGRDLVDVAIDLQILRHRGIFDRIAGMVIGKLTWMNEDYAPVAYPPLREVVADVVAPYRFPTLTGVDFGHAIANVPLPIGIEASMDAEDIRFELVEAAVE